MAILNEYKVEILVDNVPCAEYDDDDDASAEANRPDTVTKYIEAVSGKEFQFKTSISPGALLAGAECWTAKPEVEGKKISGIIITPRGYGGDEVGYVNGEWSGSGVNTTLWKFTFADLETRDMEKGDEISKFKDKYGDLGTLKMMIWRERQLIRNENPYSVYDHAEQGGKVPEKALKGRPLDVATKYKAEYGGRRPATVTTSSIDPLPVATFIFKYRTRRALQSLMIIERSPTPLPLEERDETTLTREELQELVRRQREQAAVKKENEQKGLKRERSGTVNNTPSRPLKTSKIAGKTVYHIDSSDGEVDEPKKEKGKRAEEAESDVEGDVEVVDLA